MIEKLTEAVMAYSYHNDVFILDENKISTLVCLLFAKRYALGQDLGIITYSNNTLYNKRVMYTVPKGFQTTDEEKYCLHYKNCDYSFLDDTDLKILKAWINLSPQQVKGLIAINAKYFGWQDGQTIDKSQIMI